MTTPPKSRSDLLKLPAERITHALPSGLQCPGRESHSSCVRKLTQSLAPGLDAKTCVKGAKGPGCLVPKPVVQDSARSPGQPLPRAWKAPRSGWRLSCVKFPKSPQERNAEGVGGTVRPSGHVRPPPHARGTRGETGMFLPSSSPAFWGRPTDQTLTCTVAGRGWGRWGQRHPHGRGEAAQRSPGSRLSFEGAEAVKEWGRVSVAGGRQSRREEGHVFADTAEGPGMSSLVL